MLLSRKPTLGSENPPFPTPVPYVPINYTTTERDALTSPATGVVIFNTTTSKLNTYTGAAWEEITSA